MTYKHAFKFTYIRFETHRLTDFKVLFEVLTPVVMEIFIFWSITLCSPFKVNRRFGRTYDLHLATCIHAGSLLDLYFHPEDGDDMSLWNVGWLSAEYTALYPRRQRSSSNLSVHRSQGMCLVRLQSIGCSVRTLLCGAEYSSPVVGLIYTASLPSTCHVETSRHQPAGIEITL
jgi:hypothetical protein